SHSGMLNTDSGKARKVFSFKPESVFKLTQNRCSDWIRMGVQVGSEYAITNSMQFAGTLLIRADIPQQSHGSNVRYEPFGLCSVTVAKLHAGTCQNAFETSFVVLTLFPL
ncbi:MAG: hypothetical protein U1E01_14910, partial [Methylicorpusculum sp.]|nr:hypothetical protein [Methylicorpusculum sp.]